MMCSRQCASSSKFQAQPFHVLSWISRGWRLLKLLHSVVFSNKHPFWNASMGRMWSMAELVKVIGEWGCWSFHVLRFCSKCTYTCACASVLARLLVRYVGPCRHNRHARVLSYLFPGFHTEVLEDRLRLFEAEPFEPAHDGLDNPVRNVLLWVARGTARNSVEFTDTDRWHTACML